MPHICFLVQLLHVRGASTVLQLLHCLVVQLLHVICWCPGAGPTALFLRLLYSTSYFYGAGSVADSDGPMAIPRMLDLVRY